MELKREISYGDSDLEHGLNRTFMELKLVLKVDSETGKIVLIEPLWN